MARWSFLEVRELRQSDAVDCDEIVAGLPYHFGNEQGREDCANAVRSQDGFVAEDSGRIVGFLTWVPRFDESAEITWMAVRSDRRRTGIGRLLLERLVEELRRLGRRVLVVLTVSPHGDEGEPADGYAATRAFYRAMGFAYLRDLPGEWPGDLAVSMVMSIDA